MLLFGPTISVSGLSKINIKELCGDSQEGSGKADLLLLLLIHFVQIEKKSQNQY